MGEVIQLITLKGQLPRPLVLFLLICLWYFMMENILIDIQSMQISRFMSGFYCNMTIEIEKRNFLVVFRKQPSAKGEYHV